MMYENNENVNTQKLENGVELRFYAIAPTNWEGDWATVLLEKSIDNLNLIEIIGQGEILDGDEAIDELLRKHGESDKRKSPIREIKNEWAERKYKPTQKDKRELNEFRRVLRKEFEEENLHPEYETDACYVDGIREECEVVKEENGVCYAIVPLQNCTQRVVW